MLDLRKADKPAIDINLSNLKPKFIRILITAIIKKIIKINKVNDFISKNKDLHGFEFIDSLFDFLNFGYSFSKTDKNRLPAEGRLVIVANHPLGGLDGLALIRAVSEVRTDVKIVANNLLLSLQNLNELFLPIDVFSKKIQKENIKNIEKALSDETAVIFFPAGEVSRLKTNGIKDGKWSNGAINFAHKTKSPILPVYIKAKNSITFYAVSLIFKKLSTLMLPRELFKKKDQVIKFKFGDPIPIQSFSKSISKNEISKLLRKHVYYIPKKKKIFNTEKTVIHKSNPIEIRKELIRSELLGETSDNKKIYLVNYHNAENVLQEISRLREITFRKVGEGTGKSKDIDKFDKYYHHIVLWDDFGLEIVGSYRIGNGQQIMKQFGVEGFYNFGQFTFANEFHEIMENGMELGRSFIQQKYWGSKALVYLWQGVAAYIVRYPETKYMFGAVSISDTYTDYAKEMIVYFYKKWYNSEHEWVFANKRFEISQKSHQEFKSLFSADTPSLDFMTLKHNLRALGFSVPVLLKRYTELCEYGGVSYLDFGIDKDFADSIDSFLFLSIESLKEEHLEKFKIVPHKTTIA